MNSNISFKIDLNTFSLSLHRELQRDAPNRVSTLLCLFSPAVWVTVISVKGAIGLTVTKNVYALLKCENQKVKTQISKAVKEIEWNDVFVFYRKHPKQPIILKVLLNFFFVYLGMKHIPEWRSTSKYKARRNQAFLI